MTLRKKSGSKLNLQKAELVGLMADRQICSSSSHVSVNALWLTDAKNVPLLDHVPLGCIATRKCQKIDLNTARRYRMLFPQVSDVD